ncbi:MAG: ABC transporter permease [Methanomassiliicoccaceae archaeon]|nr:ABC transporter permease [Methanomassiliicoccaceae archaeon]
MFEFFRETYYVMWGDLKFMRHNALNILVSSIMGPLLYLLAFGFGLGQGLGVEVEGLPYIAFIIPGIAALTSLSASFSAVSARLNTQRLYYRSLDEILMCPISISSIVFGKSMQGVIRGIISSSIIFAMGLAMAPEHLHFTFLYAVSIVLSCFTFSFLGVSAALLANTHQAMATFSNLIILPMTFLCGTFFSVNSLPSVFQAVLFALPLTHSSVTARASALGWDFPWASLLVLLCFCIAFFVLNVYLIKKKKV